MDTDRAADFTPEFWLGSEPSIPSNAEPFEPLNEFRSELDDERHIERPFEAVGDQPDQPPRRRATADATPAPALVMDKRAFVMAKVLCACAALAATVVLTAYVAFGKPPSLSTEKMALPSVEATAEPREAAKDVPGVTRSLTGLWEMTNHVQATSYQPYEGLRLGFRLRLQQDGRRIRGEGHKVTENDREIPLRSRTPIRVVGVVEGRRVALTFIERGARRTSSGILDLELTEEGLLLGTFDTDAAMSSGRSVARPASETSVVMPTSD